MSGAKDPRDPGPRRRNPPGDTPHGINGDGPSALPHYYGDTLPLPSAWHLGSTPRRPYGLPGGEPGVYVPSGVREHLPIDHQPATAVATAMISQWKDNDKTIVLCFQITFK
ncbi:hypothetical protein CRE_16962 [Caenorhabditis remanei]|uniref:Uncharacterized protein n=1 Tax=Caenorhabditis remanei TaxID=31234 RepID=E3N2B5_CAERE|nr:hypothetical protein CRE_16962 [Caenorhabditis remanei]